MTPPNNEINSDGRSGNRKGRAQRVTPEIGAPVQSENMIRLIKHRKAAPTPAAAARPPMERTEPAHARQMPEEIIGRFIAIGTKYYSPDGSPAFIDRGDR